MSKRELSGEEEHVIRNIDHIKWERMRKKKKLRLKMEIRKKKSRLKMTIRKKKK